MNNDPHFEKLLGEVILGYRQGRFLMGNGSDNRQLFWVTPQRRGVIPLGLFHISHSLWKLIRRQNYEVRINTAFSQIIMACATRSLSSGSTIETLLDLVEKPNGGSWINPELILIYEALHQQGLAHSLEIWRDETLIGGLFGVALDGAFFGESMVSWQRDASKLALSHLVARLWQCGYQLLDTQFLTPHLASLGAVEISQLAYRRRLNKALKHMPLAFETKLNEWANLAAYRQYQTTLSY